MRQLLETIPPKNRLYFFLYVIVHIVFVITMNMVQVSNDKLIVIYTLFAFIQLIFSIYTLINFEHKLISISTLFLLFTFIFHFGQQILYIFDYEIVRNYNIFIMVPQSTIINACRFAIFSIFYIVCGMVFVSCYRPRTKSNRNDEQHQQTLIYKVGITIFLIGLLPKIYIDLGRMVLFLDAGYLATYTLRVPGIISLIGNLSEYGIFMMLIGSQNDRRFINRITLIFLVYEVIIMISGNRGRAIVVIITIFIIYRDLQEDFSKKQMMKLSVGGYLGLVILIFFGNLRNPYLDTVSIIDKIYMSFSSPLKDILDEFGGTMLTLCYSVLYFPRLSPPSYGINYFTSLFSVIPNFGGVLDDYKLANIYVYKFPFHSALGGSYLGELFYNFNWYGIYFSFFIGVFIGIIARNFTKKNRERDWLAYSISVIILPNIIWWVRGYFYDMVRDIILVPIIIITIYCIHRKINGCKHKMYNR